MEYAKNALKKKSPEIEVFEKYASEYDRWFDEKGKLIFQTEVALFKTIERFHLHPSIEIGSGSGRFTESLSIDYAIEPSKKLREISIKRGIIPIAKRGENIPFDDGVFKTVFIIVTLCFAKRPELLLKEAFRILHKDGNLILGLVLADSTWGSFYIEKKRQGHRFYKVANFYTLYEVENMLQSSGFEIYDIYSTLISSPLNLKSIEGPIHGYIKDAGFVGIIAKKIRE